MCISLKQTMNTTIKVLLWILVIIVILVSLLSFILRKYFNLFNQTIDTIIRVNKATSLAMDAIQQPATQPEPQSSSQEGYAFPCDGCLTAQTYDHGKMPFQFSRQAVDLYTTPMFAICNPIVQTQCKENQTIPCVTEALQQCANAHRNEIASACDASVANTLCGEPCRENPASIPCQACQGLAKVQRICVPRKLHASDF